MLALKSRVLRRRLSVPTSGSARRRAWQRKQAEVNRAEGERIAREKREQRTREKLELQRKVREDLASYEPWGRAGGGAPNPHGVRFTNIRAKGIIPEDELKGVNYCDEYSRWADMRRRSNKRAYRFIRLREDPQTCYADNLRKTIDNDIRYRQNPTQQNSYKQILDALVENKKKVLREEIKKNLEYEKKMLTMDVPWGKPGPGGTTWRNPRNIGLNFSNSMGWTDNEVFNKIKRNHNKHKRSSLTLPKVLTEDEKGDESTKENIVLSDHKLPDINQNVIANNSLEDSHCRYKENVKQETSVNKEKLKDFRKKKLLKKLPNGDRIIRNVADIEESRYKNGNEMKPVYEKELNITPEETILRMTGGVELVPLLARRRRVGARTLHSSDVTCPPEQMCQWREMMDVDYLRELKNQMRLKYKQKEIQRKDSAESVRQHHETWASLWGRPGHGAPQLRGKYARNNLAKLLYLAPLTIKN